MSINTHTHTHMYIYILMYVYRHTFTYILSLFLHLSIIIISYHLLEDYEFPTDNSSPLQHHNTDTVCLSFQPGNSLFNREEIGSHYPQYISLFDGPLHVTAFLSLHTALRRHPTCPGWMPPLALRCVISLVDDFSSIPSWSLCIFLFNFYLI